MTARIESGSCRCMRTAFPHTRGHEPRGFSTPTSLADTPREEARTGSQQATVPAPGAEEGSGARDRKSTAQSFWLIQAKNWAQLISTSATVDRPTRDSVERMRFGQRQRVGLVRTIGARLPVRRGVCAVAWSNVRGCPPADRSWPLRLDRRGYLRLAAPIQAAARPLRRRAKISEAPPAPDCWLVALRWRPPLRWRLDRLAWPREPWLDLPSARGRA
jgi:hypothetical protein